MCRDWLAVAFLCTVASPRISSCLVRSFLVCFALLLSCLLLVILSCLLLPLLFCLLLAWLLCLLLAWLFCLLLAFLFSVLFIIAPDLRVLLAGLLPLLLFFVLLTTGSLAVVLSRILTTCSSAVVPSVFLSQLLFQSRFVVGYDSVVRF